MRQSEKHKKHIQLFVNGADYDTNPEIQGLKQGNYKDSNNMRLSGTTGDGEALQRIKGETIKYTDTGNYTCIGTQEVNEHIVEVWVNDTDSDVAFRIDGDIMLHDVDNLMKLSVNAPLQMHKADDCVGGEIYFTDFVNVPYIFNIKDIIDSFLAGSQKYFSEFDPLLHQITLQQGLNVPVFDSYVESEASGLLQGMYAYSIRYVDASGNRTLFSPPTPMIPVIDNYSSDSSIYPFSKTYGRFEATTNTRYGIRMKFRVNNYINYKYIEVRRIKFAGGGAIGVLPEAEFMSIATELAEGEVSVWEFVDDKNQDQFWEILTDEETTEQMSAIETAKAIRYFQCYLTLGNIKYASRDLEGKVEFKKINNEYAFPFVDKLGEEGYANPYNSAYKKSFMGGEKYGFGLACYDAEGNVGFVVPVPDFENYMFPNRREQASANTFKYSETNWKGMPRAADVNGITETAPGLNDGVPVHEKFQKKKKKKQQTELKSLLCTQYNCLKPRYYNDAYTDHRKRINNMAIIDHNWFLNTPELSSPYEPEFGLDYYGLGLMLAGIKTLPDWVVGFSIVRTKPANRVVGQGIVTYKFKDTPQTKLQRLLAGMYEIVSKEKERICFFSDDIENALSQIQLGHKLQLVSPLGYFAEMYNCYRDSAEWPGDRVMFNKNIDIILYARELFTDPGTFASPSLLKQGTSGGSYWTQFGYWRNNFRPVAWPYQHIFNINSYSTEKFKGVGRSNYLLLELGQDIYHQEEPQPLGGTPKRMNTNSVNNQAFQEPFYIANIIDDGAEVKDGNINDYILIGNYIKVISTIGIGTGTAINYELVDERWEDCIVNPHLDIVERQAENVFVYVNGRRWLNIAHKTTADLNIIIADLTTNGEYEADLGDGTTETIYGVYNSEFNDTGNYNKERGTIIFQSIIGLDNVYTIPDVETEIKVKYDNRFPIRVYGGDVSIGESMFLPVDGESERNGNVKGNDQLYTWTCLPHAGYTSHPDEYRIMDKTTGGTTNQFTHNSGIGIIRQLMVMATTEARSHLPYSRPTRGSGNACDAPAQAHIVNSFPRVHFVMRPNRWKETCADNFESGGGNIGNDYKTDYSGEFERWTRGGFRFMQLIANGYSQHNNYDNVFAKPKVGYEEQTHLCTRIIWSVKRNINQQGNPNLKTFLSSAKYDISDNMQEIKFLYDNDSNKGNNLIALTGKGVCLLVTDKRIISELSGNELVALPSDRLITNEVWLSKTIGNSNEMWRGNAEYNNMLYFPSSESVYRLTGLQIDDILRHNKGSYFTRLHPVLQDVRAAYGSMVSWVYNVKDDEYWLHINNLRDINADLIRGIIGIYVDMGTQTLGLGDMLTVTSVSNVFVYTPPMLMTIPIGGAPFEQYYYIRVQCPQVRLMFGSTLLTIAFEGNIIKLTRMTNETTWTVELVSMEDVLELMGKTFVYNNNPQKQVWKGTNDYFADKFLNVYGREGSKELQVLAMRNYDTYELGKGTQIGGVNIDGSVKIIIAADPYVPKKFIDQTINCSLEPDEITYSNIIDIIEGTQTEFRNYTHAYYTQIPRKTALPRDRFQGQFIEVDIHCAKVGEFNIRTIESGYKIIK